MATREPHVIEILHEHTPLSRRFLVDRLEKALQRIERAEEDLDELEAVADALEKKDNP